LDNGEKRLASNDWRQQVQALQRVIPVVAERWALTDRTNCIRSLMIIQAFRWKEDNRSFLYDLLV